MRSHALPAPLLLILVVAGNLGCGENRCAGPDFEPPEAIVVRSDGSEKSHSTIQAAIDAADSSDVVELTDGVFRGDGNRDLDCGNKPITIRSRSGDPSACIIDCEADSLDPHRAMDLQSRQEARCLLQGITVRGGYPPNYGGGAIRCEDSSLRVENCRFVANAASVGGALVASASTVTISGCSFSANEAAAGGAVFCDEDAMLTLENCIFADNAATDGGGVSCRRARLTMMGCEFIRNASTGSGGAVECYDASLTCSDCVFEVNTAKSGGAVFAWFEPGMNASHCFFRANVAEYHGGAVLFQQCSGSLEFCTFIADSAGHSGGAFGCFSGWFDEPCYPSLIHCTLYANFVPEDAYYGGAAISSYGFAWPSLHNTIVACSVGNEAVACGDDATLDVTCCDFFGNVFGNYMDFCVCGLEGQHGNISEDPLFVDPARGDLSLQPSSPCAPSGGECGLIGAWPVSGE